MKFNLKYTFTIVFIGFVSLSCEKTKVEIPESNDPVFMMDGIFNGEEISLVAGNENAYMFTMTEIHKGVNFYAGRITDGGLSLKLGVYDGFIDKMITNTQVDIVNSSPVFSSMSSGPLAVFSKYSFANEANINYIEWSVDGNFVGIDEFEIFEPGEYDVCARMFFNSGLSESYCNTVILGYERSANFSINYVSNQLGNLDASIDNMGYNIVDVKWYSNGALISDSNGLQMDLPAGFSVVKAVVQFDNNAQRTKSFLVHQTNPYYSAEDLTEFEIVNSSLQQDFNLEIEFVKDGITYHSKFSDNSNATIVLNSVEFYGKNAMNNDVYKIDAAIQGFVRSGGGAIDYPASFNVVFGVEIP